MTDIKFVKRKIGQSYFIWFKNSNLYYQFEEPVWYVFSKIIKRYKSETISKLFSVRYSLSYEESLAFVKDIRNKVDILNQSLPQDNYSQSIPDLHKYKFEAYSNYKYSFGNKVVQFIYETDWLEDYIHPLLKHLKVLEKEDEVFLFELFTHKNRVIFRYNNVVKGSWTDQESNYVKGKIFMELINVFHDKSDKDWLMTVHASAISNGKKTLLFSAPPGGGKTTIAALLVANGYQLISDDFVPIDLSKCCAYPFPSAMSIKEGSLELLLPLFPKLSAKALNYITPQKKVKFLDVENRRENMLFPVQELLFIKFNKSVDFTLEKINQVDGIKLLLEQTWVAPSYCNAEIFFERVSQFSFYQLTYSDNRKALKAIKQLFDNE